MTNIDRSNAFESPDDSEISCDLLSAPDWNNIIAAELTTKPDLIAEHTLQLATDCGLLNITIANSTVRIRSAQARPLNYGLLSREPDKLPLTLEQDEECSKLAAARLAVTIVHQPLSIEIVELSSLDSTQEKRLLSSADDGHFVRRHRLPPLARTEDGWLVSLGLNSGEPVYGLGEKWGALNKRGQLLRSYNSDALGVNAEISYKNAPFCWSPEGWGVFFHTPAPVTHAVGVPTWSQRSYVAIVEDDELDLFILVADEAEENKGRSLIQKYTGLTGRAPLPPAWSTGVILSKAYYQTADEILQAARQVREKNMPCDVITFDGRAWQDTDTRFSFEWSPSRYPDPAKIINQLKDLNFKICVWEYPLISTKNPWFDEFAEKGWLIKDVRSGEAYRYQWDQQAFGSVLTPLPESGIVDFTHPDAYQFWLESHKPLFDLGVDMIKADFGEQITDPNMQAYNGEKGRALHNVYAYLYNRCVFEAAERYSKSGPFLFSRAAWIGSQRFNSHWGGDPQADWEGMMANIRGGLSWGLSGGPFYATDVGGFYKDTRNDELYVRWAQAAIFSAHFRLHGIGAREPWSYSPAAESAVMTALSLRYQLQHYLLKAMQCSAETGMPVQRAMVLAFPAEKQSWSFENQFMFGDDLLVVPCFDPQGEVEFYLPEGQWVKFDPENQSEQTPLQGSRVHRQFIALDEMAVWVRVGSEIPLSSAVEYTDMRASLDSMNEQSLPPIERVWLAN